MDWVVVVVGAVGVVGGALEGVGELLLWRGHQWWICLASIPDPATITESSLSRG
jgi:hypothetical protein